MDFTVSNGPWQRFKIQLRKTWNALTDDDLEAITRDRDGLVHVVQERYRCERVKAVRPPRIARREFQAAQYLPASNGLRIRVRS